MAGWDCYYNNDDDVLNLNLFARKSFGFQGIPQEKEDVLKKIVTHIGASCDEYPKYIFTSIEHYNSLTTVNSALYNETYIRDCVDANRCLTIEHYKLVTSLLSKALEFLDHQPCDFRLGPKYTEKKEYREFDPCCANFHNGNKSCLICDPTSTPEIPLTTKKLKNKSTIASEPSTTRIKKENKIQNVSAVDHDSNDADSKLGDGRKFPRPWEPWEDRMIVDYFIAKKLIPFSRGTSVYKEMKANGYLKNRTAESARLRFRLYILRDIESFDLPPAILKEFRKLRKAKRVVATYKQMHGMKNSKVRKK